MKIPNIDDFKSKIGEGGGYANPSLFYVSMPPLNGSTNQRIAIEFFVKSISLPARSLLTTDRELGTDMLKVPYGYQNAELSMTFMVMNDHLTRHYIETWQQSIVQDTDTNLENNYRIAYPDDYLRDIRIFQLDKGSSRNLFGTSGRVGNDVINVNLGATVSLKESASIRYAWHIMDAFPISFNQETLSNDASGISEISISFAYRKWKGYQIPRNPNTNIDVSVSQTNNIEANFGGKIYDAVKGVIGSKRGRRI